MNKKLYNALRYVPIVGTIVRIKCNYLGFMPSCFIGDWVCDKKYDVLKDWIKANPDQVLSPKKAKELMEKARN